MAGELPRPSADLPPHDADRERSVLATLCFCSTTERAAVLVRLRPEMLYYEKHRTVLLAIGRLHAAGGPVDFVGLAGELELDRQALDVIPLLAAAPTAYSFIPGHIDALIGLWQKRELLAQAERLLVMARNGADPAVLIERTQSVLNVITSTATPLATTPLGIGLGDFLGQSFPDREALIEGILSADGSGWLGG